MTDFFHEEIQSKHLSERKSFLGKILAGTIDDTKQLDFNDAASGYSAHLGVQATSGLLARSTTQTAIVLGAGMGSLPPFGKSTKNRSAIRFRDGGCQEMQGVIGTAVSPTTVVDIGHENRKKSGTARRYFNEAISDPHKDERVNRLRRKLLEADDYNVEFVLTPIDGARALARGASGAMSVAAVGAPQCFVLDEKETSYFCLAIGKSKQAADIEQLVEDLKNLGQCIAVEEVLKCIGNALDRIESAANIAPVVALTFEGPYKSQAAFKKLDFDCWHRKRVLEGSTVAAALAAFLDKVDCSLFVTRWPQLIQSAIAALGLGGNLIAIPFVKKNLDPLGLRTEEQFVAGRNAILCTTSISEVCVLDRVRFGRDFTANTDTITVSLATGRITRQSDSFPLHHSNARDPDGYEVKLIDRIHSFWCATPSSPPTKPR